MLSESTENRQQLIPGPTDAERAPQLDRILIRKALHVAPEAMRDWIFARSLKLGGIETRTDKNPGPPDLGKLSQEAADSRISRLAQPFISSYFAIVEAG